MVARRSRSLGAVVARAAGAAFAVAVAVGGASLAASPVPSAPASDTTIEAWLDEPFTADARVGAKVENGVTMWDRAHGQLLELSDAYVRLHPAKGSAKPTEARARADWPGHLAFEIAIPKGGPGLLETGFEGQTCTASGACTETRFPFAFGGYGPPPDAPRSVLVTATVLSPQSPVMADEALDVVVDVVPKGAWDPARLELPDRLVAFVGAIGGSGPDLASAELRATSDPRPEPGTTYAGQIRIPQAGTMRLLVAIPGNGTEDDVLPTLTRLTVTGAGGGSSPPPTAAGGPAAPPEPGPPWALIVGGLAGVVAAGLVIRTAFADL
jgi:hypothetical protein